MRSALRAGPVSGARFEALRILVRVERDRAFADITLEHALEKARLEPRDAALCAEVVYGTLRWQRHLDWRLAPHLRTPIAKLDPWVRVLLRLTAYQLLFLTRIPAWAAVDEAVSLARLKSRTPGPASFVNAVLRSLTRTAEPPPLPQDPDRAAALRWSFPDWIATRWIDRYGLEQAGALMRALNERPPLTVRTNRRRATRESLIARLWEEERIEARPTGLAPEGLIIADGGRPGQWRAFADGWCVVQDEASMLVARLLDPRPGELVVDACAAPGTKATHLAELMDDRGRVLALDPHARRLGLLEASARRLGLTILEGHPGSVDKHAGRWRDRADRVLVDAPCSNLGVLRRNPEVKWRRTAGDIEGLNRQQQAILSSAARMARSGGWLVYATCSLEPDENEEVVLPFLRAHPDWGIEAPAEFPVGPDARGFIRLWPHLHGSDGFTAIRLRRR